jgi:lysophospholipase L1-like esterase
MTITQALIRDNPEANLSQTTPAPYAKSPSRRAANPTIMPATTTPSLASRAVSALPGHLLKTGARPDILKLRQHGLLKPHDSVLFIGDSITDAFRKPEEINNAYQMGAGYVLIIAARLTAEHPEAKFNFINRGISGHRVTHLVERWERDCMALNPHVVSLLVGVNSTLGKYCDKTPPSDADFDTFYAIYDRLLTGLITRKPQVRLVLCEPFLLPCGLATPELVSDIRLRARYVHRLAKKHKAIFVPFQEAFDRALSRAPAEYWAYDGVHPTAAGFWLLAQTWLQHVTK